MRVVLASIALFSLLQGLDAAPAVEARGAASTRNDISNGDCKPYTLIFARGTSEPLGNLGIVGTPFAAALKDKLRGDCAVQGVNYAATPQGAISGGDAAGSTAMYNLVLKACPSTKIILGGYSQGAQLVHNAVAKMSNAQAKRISAIVTFGDPERSKAYGHGLAAKATTYCHKGDTLCAKPMPNINSCGARDYGCLLRVGKEVLAMQKTLSGENVPPSHKTYPNDCDAAAAFARRVCA
ncbi:Cutinase [Arthrobotrys entomopaga]|nr:Cutinase [Arthrobotrys entomopaga]